jgi:hypothetical protein
MIRRPAGCLGIDPAEPKLGQIEFVNKDIDDPNGIILADPVFKAVRKQRALPAIRASTKRPIRSHINRAGIIPQESFEAERFHTARVKSRHAAQTMLLLSAN